MSLPLSVLPFNESRVYKFDYRSLIPTPPGSLWRIESGLVRSLTWLEDGTIVALGLWGKGDVVGDYLTKVEPYQVECLTKVEAVSLSLESLHTMGDLLLQHIQLSEELMVIRSYKRADVMLLKLLAWLAKRFGSEVERGQLIDLRLTHQDLSELLGITRVTITRLLSQLEQQGFIQRLSLQRIILKQEEFWHYEI
ncbi:MAG: Crp/Fnr family transcriptional regulator [Oculatellaceae cyanobacterium bins.114]|nr:Crp/Fnr family transcriptional regulator [Oculatellaceae cyanobacterium bins.114]